VRGAGAAGLRTSSGSTTPRNAIASVKFNDTCVSVQPVIETSGPTNTLQP
jgi:hypothetical protein